MDNTFDIFARLKDLMIQRMKLKEQLIQIKRAYGWNTEMQVRVDSQLALLRDLIPRTEFERITQMAMEEFQQSQHSEEVSDGRDQGEAQI